MPPKPFVTALAILVDVAQRMFGPATPFAFCPPPPVAPWQVAQFDANSCAGEPSHAGPAPP